MKLYEELASWWPLLSAREDWLRLLTDAGFQPKPLLFDHSELEPGSYELFIARRR